MKSEAEVRAKLAEMNERLENPRTRAASAQLWVQAELLRWVLNEETE